MSQKTIAYNYIRISNIYTNTILYETFVFLNKLFPYSANRDSISPIGISNCIALKLKSFGLGFTRLILVVGTSWLANCSFHSSLQNADCTVLSLFNCNRSLARMRFSIWRTRSLCKIVCNTKNIWLVYPLVRKRLLYYSFTSVGYIQNVSISIVINGNLLGDFKLAANLIQSHLFRPTQPVPHYDDFSFAFGQTA